MTPYFQHLASQKRMCPICHGQTHFIRCGPNPNAMAEECDCGYSQVIVAPESARVEYNPDKRGKIIPFDAIRNRK